MKNLFSIKPDWDNEQLIVLNSKPNIIIEGGAGSGKTLLAIYLAKQMIEEGERRVSIIVYTKSLRTFIEHTLHNLNIDEVNVFYKDQLNGFKNLQHDFIIVDEAQDFSVQDILKFKEQAKKGLFIFGDDKQKLYEQNSQKEKTLTLSELQQTIHFPVITLKHNHRISKNIADFISDLHSDSSLSNCLFDSNYKPVFIKCNTPEDELSYIKQYIAQNHQEDIGILMKQNDSRKEASYSVNRKSKKIKIPGILETKEFLSTSGIEIGYKCKDEDNLNFTNDRNVNIMTFHSSKGLQFDTVILPFSNIVNGHTNLCVNYVGMTRAKSKLIVTYSDIISREYDKIPKQELYDGEIRFYNMTIDAPSEVLRDLELMRQLGL